MLSQRLQYEDTPIAKIENLSYPEEVPYNTPFTIEYDVRNVGAVDGVLWGRIVDQSTGDVIQGTKWNAEVPAGDAVHITNEIQGIEEDMLARVEVGHMGGPSPPPTPPAPKVPTEAILALLSIAAIGIVGAVIVRR